jgi:hypothetical protein
MWGIINNGMPQLNFESGSKNQQISVLRQLGIVVDIHIKEDNIIVDSGSRCGDYIIVCC